MADLAALGLIETRGLTALMEATDAALKAATVDVVGWRKVGSGMVTAFVAGDVAAVKSAVTAAETAAARIGEVLGTHVIPRPHDELEALYPPAAKKPAARKS